MLMTEIISLKSLRRDLMHRRARVCHSPDLICIEFFPPIEWSSNIHIHHDHPHEFPMICAGVTEIHHEFPIVGTKIILILSVVLYHKKFVFVYSGMPYLLPTRITLLPRVHRIAHTPNRMFPAQDFGVFEFNHFVSPFNQ